MRIGVCGTGNVASWICGILNELKDDKIQLYACATSPGFDCTGFAKKFHFSKKCNNFEELIADPMVDLVYIAVPNNLHLNLVLQALNAGKNVICEKPMAINLDEAKQMTELADKKGVFFMEALWASFLPLKKEVQEKIAQGVIGDIREGHIIQMDNVMFLSRVSSLDLGGGYLLDNGPYTLGWMTDYFGLDVKDIQAKMRKLDTGVDAEDWLTVTYKNGSVVTIQQAMDKEEAEFETKAEIIGTKGKICFDEIANPKSCQIFDSEGELINEIMSPPLIKNPGNPPVSGYNFEFQAAEAAIASGEKECAEASHKKSLTIAGLMTEARKKCGLIYPFE